MDKEWLLVDFIGALEDEVSDTVRSDTWPVYAEIDKFVPAFNALNKERSAKGWTALSWMPWNKEFIARTSFPDTDFWTPRYWDIDHMVGHFSRQD